MLVGRYPLCSATTLGIIWHRSMDIAPWQVLFSLWGHILVGERLSKCETPGPLIADCQSQTEQPELREKAQSDLGKK